MSDAPDTAMLRDASWFNRPNTRSIKKYHVANGDMASCDTHRCPLSEFTAIPLADVRKDLRCQRRGCKEWWPA